MITEESIIERATSVIADQMGLKRSDVTTKTTLNDMGADSLDNLEITMALEDEFEIEIPDEVTEKVKSVRGYVDYISGVLL